MRPNRQYVVETIEIASGWAVKVWKEEATRREDGILWSVGDTDVRTLPTTFLKWPIDTWIQIMWTTTGGKDFMQLKDVKWKRNHEKVEVLVKGNEASEMAFQPYKDKMEKVTEYDQISRRRVVADCTEVWNKGKGYKKRGEKQRSNESVPSMSCRKGGRECTEMIATEHNLSRTVFPLKD